MKPELRRIGTHDSALVVVDDFTGDPAAVIDTAATLAPFPAPAGGYYPGLRRVLDERDGDAWAYVQATMRAAAPFIGGAFDADGFDLIEASFSMVTTPPHALGPAQRAPHFDSTDADYLAVLHYLGGTADTGTAFYRQRATGIERVDEANLPRFVATARTASGAGYIAGDDAHYEQVAAVAAKPDRLVIYQGCLLHSGIIPPTLPLSPDPRIGRLTANFFVKARRSR